MRFTRLSAALALASITVGAAAETPSSAQVRLADFRATLVDLDLDDGVAPGLTVSWGSTVVGVRNSAPPEYIWDEAEAFMSDLYIGGESGPLFAAHSQVQSGVGTVSAIGGSAELYAGFAFTLTPNTSAVFSFDVQAALEIASNAHSYSVAYAQLTVGYFSPGRPARLLVDSVSIRGQEGCPADPCPAESLSFDETLRTTISSGANGLTGIVGLSLTAITAITAAPTAAVPEPQAWMLLLAGCGAIACTKRSRQT